MASDSTSTFRNQQGQLEVVGHQELRVHPCEDLGIAPLLPEAILHTSLPHGSREGREEAGRRKKREGIVGKGREEREEMGAMQETQEEGDER